MNLLLQSGGNTDKICKGGNISNKDFLKQRLVFSYKMKEHGGLALATVNGK